MTPAPGQGARARHSCISVTAAPPLCHHRDVIRAELGLGILGTGLWIFCLLDVIMTDEHRIRNLSKGTWVFIVIVTSVVGAVACFYMTLPVTGRDPVQYTIAAWLLGIGVVLWALTWAANRAFFGRKTYLREPEELAGEDSTVN